MRTTALLFFYLLLCCQHTESLTNKRVILGENVTLDCDIDIKDIYWLSQKPSESLVVIFRSFTSDSTSPMFTDPRLRNKYSSLTNSSLFISNITKDELGIYYCAKLYLTALTLGNGTKLYISEAAYQNETEENDQHNNTIITQHSALTHTSILLNVLLLIIIIGLLIPRCPKPRKSVKPHPNDEVELEQIEDLNTAEYSEIHLASQSTEAQLSLINATYVLLEKPKADARQT
ncbi:uncharacterized protein [Paramisgurnus dabryanus]|uniref:uncharacterized protein n=1 Tax=Paramisgurnus dabryanus TaxID=90735 RepID=UPI0031F3CEE8